jgi:HAD superfamily hydrolase (TIGR01549 family)
MRTSKSFRDYLGKENIRKGIISNMPKEWGDYLAKKFNLVVDFDPIILSGDVGVSKPDYGKYDEFLNRAGVRGEKVLFIDDKLENLIMAERFGFKTVLFDRGREQEGFEPNVKISSFKELM